MFVADSTDINELMDFWENHIKAEPEMPVYVI